MKIGFIGCGNMARAMIEGLIQSDFAKPSEIMASALRFERLLEYAEKKRIGFSSDNTEVARYANLLILAVKPQHYPEVISEISPHLKEDTVVISLAPGISLSGMQELFGRPLKLVRTMPNTPASVLEGMTALCSNALVTAGEEELVTALFESFGRIESVKESQMDAVIALSSSPAYCFMMLEAMADGAVLHGLGRQEAYVFAAQSMLGAAKMVLELGQHPAKLKDDLCSPGGTTIEAVKKLEEKGFRSAIIEALHASAEKTKRMEGKN